MHFLSHYYTELPNDNPLFVAGLGIPDLAPRFTRIYNSQLVKWSVPDDENLKQIYSGIVQHYAGDKRFHKSALFTEQVSQVTLAFAQGGLNRKKLRLSVLAHLAVEMLIDRQIISEREDICHRFYAAVERADEKVLNSFFDIFLTDIEKRNYFLKFSFFKERKFLFLFRDLTNIVFAMNRVYGSVTGTEFDEEEKRKFLTVISNIDSGMRYSWKKILS